MRSRSAEWVFRLANVSIELGPTGHWAVGGDLSAIDATQFAHRVCEIVGLVEGLSERAAGQPWALPISTRNKELQSVLIAINRLREASARLDRQLRGTKLDVDRRNLCRVLEIAYDCAQDGCVARPVFVERLAVLFEGL